MAISWCAKRKGGPAKRERAMGTSGGLRPMSISMFGKERLGACAARGSRTHARPPRGSVSARVNLQLGQRRSGKERKIGVKVRKGCGLQEEFRVGGGGVG